MIHFFDYMLFDNNSKSDKVIIAVFSLLSGVFSADFLFWMSSLEHIVKALMGMAGAAIGAVVVKITLTAYERYLKDKIFKPRKNEKEETEKRA